MSTRSRWLVRGVTALMLGGLSSGSWRSVHAQEGGPGPVAARAVNFAESPALGDLAAAAAETDRSNEEEETEAAENRAIRTLTIPGPMQVLLRALGVLSETPDAAVQTEAPTPSLPAPLTSFDGISNQDNSNIYGFRVFPPDTNGDVGPNHYLQFVNDLVRIYLKDGTPLTPAFRTSQLFRALGGICATNNNGDGIVLYDPLADRWLVSQFAFTAMNTPPYHECIAISKTGDPMGPFFLYDFITPGNEFPDYPHLGVWPDAYYMTTNQFLLGGTTFDGAGAFAFERGKMLAGDPTASLIYFNLRLASYPEGIGGMLPSDLDGLTPPPAGRPNTFVYFTADEFLDPKDGLRLFDFHADFATPANSTFSERPESTYAAPLPVASFNPSTPPGRRDIQQPPPATNLMAVDAIADRLMHRLQYRNAGAYESLVVTHTVNVGTGNMLGTFRAGVRYYEVRHPLPAGSFAVHEQATFAPADGNNRWMGSAAMDHQGNLAVGYSVSSTSTFPSVRYAARLAGDPPGGLFQGEATLAAGSGVQLNSTTNRWGDYSGMTVDPVDDCTFWYTNEYYTAASQATSTVGWLTRIGSFKADPGCSPPPMGTLQGTIRFADTDGPVSGALVQVSDGHSAATLPDGTYAIKLSPGVYTVSASYLVQGCASPSATVIITDGGVTTFDAALDGPAVLVFESASVSGGNGNGVIDFNECNSLSVTLRNLGCSKGTGITAALSSSTSGVTIEQPNSSYPDAPRASSVTNQVLFDVSTAPGFLCGTPIDFALTVISAGGSQVLPFRLPTCTAPAATVSGSIAAGDSAWTGSRLFRDGVASVCATPKSCPGTSAPGLTRRYDKYSFTNSGGVSACVNVNLTSGCSTNIFGATYLGGFNPANVCQNYLADAGASSVATARWAFKVPPGQAFDLVVHEVNPNTGCANYAATVSGLFASANGGGECLPCTISCPGPGSIVAANAPGQCGAVVDFQAALSSGSCGVVTSSHLSGAFFPVGSTSLTSSTTAGPSCSRTITVNDVEQPTVTAPPSVSVSTGPGAASCGAFVPDAVLGTATASDNCAGVTITRSGVPAGNVFPVGTTTVTYTATDASGNTSSATQTVTVVDNTPPSIVAPLPVNVSTGAGAASCGALVPDAVLGTATASDNCGVTITRSGVPAGNIFPVGTTTVTYTATDASGNTSSANQTVTVVDNTPPSIAAPPAVSVSTGPGAASCATLVPDAVLGTATASDHCSDVTITRSGVPAGNIFPVGTTTVTYTATDASGNTSSATQTVTVADNTPPAIAAPPAVSVSTGPGAASCAAFVPDAVLGMATASDQCGDVTITRTGVPAGNIFPVGTTTVVYTATDASGNTSSATQTVTVVDNTPPSIAAPPAVSVSTGAGAAFCATLVPDAKLGTATASDNCGGVTITRSGVPAGNIFPVGTTTVVYTATDASGNKSSATQTVTVVDNTPPKITGAAVDKPVLWPPNHKMVNVTVSYTSTDNCTASSCKLSVSVSEGGDKDGHGDADDDDDHGDGHGEQDWQIIDAHHVRRRAERSGHEGERIYTITITCRDGRGNTSTKTVKVRVPHDQHDH